MRPTLAALALVPVLAGASGCVTRVEAPAPVHNPISILSPRCPGLSSCVVGHVTAARTAAPIAEAAVFLVRELAPGEDEPIRFFARTDEEGVVVVAEPPTGSYRIAVYKDANSVEVMGVELGRAGTTLLPVRLTME